MDTDIFNVLHFIDDNKLFDKLPSFVAADPDLLPLIKLTDGDLMCVMNKICDNDTKIKQMKSEVINTMLSSINSTNSLVTSLTTELRHIRQKYHGFE